MLAGESHDMGAMTVADEFLLPVPVLRFVALATARERQRRMTSLLDAVPSDFATAATTVGLDVECKYERNRKTA